jgi:hypothetical protein
MGSILASTFGDDMNRSAPSTSIRSAPLPVQKVRLLPRVNFR